MGLFTHTVAGGALILIGSWESLASAAGSLKQQIPPPQLPASPPSNAAPETASFSSTVTFLLISVLSLLFAVNSFLSLSDAVSSKDNVGFALQLEAIAVAFLFLLYSLLGLFTNTKGSFRFPFKLLNVVYSFAFGEEFLLFYTQNKDPSGIENRYYDLILVPIAICLVSTVLELKSRKSVYPRLGRGVGLVLQGMWTVQMGFSFFSNLISSGCDLHERSRGNYTIKCKGHPEYHRGRAIATLQFNCHLAFLVTLGVVVYSVFCKKYGISRDFMHYKPIGVGDNGMGMESDNHSQFTLESDDENDGGDVIKEAGSVEMQQKSIVVVTESTVNGYGSHA